MLDNMMRASQRLGVTRFLHIMSRQTMSNLLQYMNVRSIGSLRRRARSLSYYCVRSVDLEGAVSRVSAFLFSLPW